jgi:DNA-directed RNA polymerase specialized sigma24 family protein
LLDIPSGTVKSRLSHARTRLQACAELGLIHTQAGSA